MQPKLVDSHCHLERVDLAPFDHDFDKMLEATHQLGVETLLCVSIDLESFPAIHSIARRYPHIYCSVGVHPTEEGVEEPSLERLMTLGRGEKVVAIGETGLDYYRLEAGRETAQKALQRTRFECHVEAANQLQKPLIIHTRMAQADTLAVLRQCAKKAGVFHCFTEDWEMAKAGLDLGFYISFSGIVTFKNATELQAVAKKIPLDRLLIETDAPYLTPVPYRGKPNYPGNVHYVAKFLAEIRSESYETIAEKTTENAKELFGLG
jgi:TatD DNase family protein